MGCTGSKYHTLNGETSGPVETTPQITSSPDPPVRVEPGLDKKTSSSPASETGVSVKAPTKRQPVSPSKPDTSDVDYDLEPANENLEERFPPWKYEADQKTWNKTLSNPMPMPNGMHSAGQRFAEQQDMAPSFENTVIIFDWDDTLLCSSALHCCLPNQFHELEEVVEAVLLMAMKLGRTMIVTNAMESWIQETAQRFMPRLLPTLERLLIVYARKNHERLWPGDTFAWKRETFRELLNDKFGRYLNLLVVGDSLSEIRAAENVAESLGTSALVKTVKFKAMPSPSDLLGELRTFGPQLGTLVEARYSATKEFHQDFTRAENGLQRSQNWFLLDTFPLDTETPPPGIFAQAPLWNASYLANNQITTI